MSASVKRPVGRPPTFTGDKSVTKVRLRLTRHQWNEIERLAEVQGKSFREFLRQRLRGALADVLE